MRRLGAATIIAVCMLGLTSSAQGAAKPFAVTTSQRGGVISVRIAPGQSNPRWGAYLNGRNITSALGYVAPRGRSIVISPTNGVRFGRNRFVVRVLYPSGRRRIIRRAFTVSRQRPLAAAGRDRRLLGPGRVVLSAAGSIAARAGSLRYRWVIARKPAHSRAKLIGATTRRPRLLTDVAGTYMLHLVLRERRRGASAAVSQPSIDLVQVQQSASNAKQGVFVAAEGLTTSAGKLRVSSGPFAGTYAIGTAGVGATSPDVAIFFDRATMEPLPKTHPSPYLIASNKAGAETLSTALAAAQKEASELGHTVGMVLAATNAGGYSSSFGEFLTNTVKATGVPLVGAGTPFALYAVPGVAETSWTSTGAGQQREFAGLLAPDSAGNFSLAPSTVPSFGQTTVTYATSPAGITVNGSTIPSGSYKPCAAAPGGYQVRIVEAATLLDVPDAENGRTFWTNSCDDNTGAVQTQAMLNMIQRDALAKGLPPRLAIVQGVGIPQHANPGGNLERELLVVAGQIRQLGGSAEAFLENPTALTGPSYALLGKNFQTNGAVGSSDSSQAEVTSDAPSSVQPEAALSGALARDRQWRFVVAFNAAGSALSGAAGTANMQLLNAAQTINPTTLAPTAFPTQPNWLAMSDYTARKYDYTDNSVEDDQNSLCAPMPPAPHGSSHKYEIDVRYLYCGGGKSQGGWGEKATALIADVNDGQTPPPPGIAKSSTSSSSPSCRKRARSSTTRTASSRRSRRRLERRA